MKGAGIPAPTGHEEGEGKKPAEYRREQD